MHLKAGLGRVLAIAVLSTSVVAWFPQSASATPSLSISASADPNIQNSEGFVVSGTADNASYLYVLEQNTNDGGCATTEAAEQSQAAKYVDAYNESAGEFQETDNYTDNAGSYVLCSYLTANNDAAASSPPDAAATSQPFIIGACIPAPSFTMSHISVTTTTDGHGLVEDAALTVQANTDGGDLTATGTTAPPQTWDGGGSSSTTYTVDIEDASSTSEAKTYHVTFTPYDPYQGSTCYDTSTGTVINDNGGQSATQTLTVTYFTAGNGGRGMVNGTVIPGSDTATPVPGAPSPTIHGRSRVGATDTCSAVAPSGDSVGDYAWYVGSSEVASGQTYVIPARAYQMHLACVARAYNDALQPGQFGASQPVTVALGAPLRATNRPGLTGATGIGGTIRVLMPHNWWSPSATSYRYQWFVGSAKIKGATRSKYKIAKKYKGKKIACEVTASAPGYARGSATSKPIKVA